MSRSSSFSSSSDVNFDDLDDQQVFRFLEDDDDSRPSSPGNRSKSLKADFRLNFSSRISSPRAPPPPAAASNKPVARKSVATTKPRSPSLTPKKRIVKRSSLTISTPTSKLFSRTRGSSVQNVLQTSASQAPHSDLFLDLVPVEPLELPSSGEDTTVGCRRTSKIQEAVAAVNSKPRKAKTTESNGGSGSVAALGNANALVAALASLQAQVELLTSEKNQLEFEATAARTTIENLEQKVAASEQSSDLFAVQLANVKESFQAKLMAREEEVSLERMTLAKEKETQLQLQQARFTTEAELWKHEIAALTKVKLELEGDNERLSKELCDETLLRGLVEVKQRELKAELGRTTEELQVLLQDRDRFDQAQVEIRRLQAQMAENQQDHERQRQQLQDRESRLLLEKDEQVAEWERERQLRVRQNDQEKAKLLRFVQEVRDLHHLLHVSVTEARELFNVEAKKTKDTLGVIQQRASEFAVLQSDREVALMSRKGRILQLETQLKNDRQTINQLEATLAKSTRVLENKLAALKTKFQEQKEHLEITLAVRQGLTTDLHAKRQQVAELEREVARLRLAKAKVEVRRKHSQQQILAMQKLHARNLNKPKKVSSSGSSKLEHTPLLEENNEISPEEPEWREFVELIAAYEEECQLQLK
ncbi:hypothetical protein DVH05_003183 [Phytophthora capsici]|nr:hypothetical protein DVH05_003183 [Phytophthora capsici]